MNMFEFFTLKNFWRIIPLKKCWADWPYPAGERVKHQYRSIFYFFITAQNIIIPDFARTQC
jgi:hypothetical protein